MKRLILFAGLYCLHPNLQANSLNLSVKKHATPFPASDRAMAHFKSNYADAADVEWFKPDGKDMYALFHEGDKTEHVFYNNDGYWQYTLISYPPTSLDKNATEQVLNFYDGYHISYVNEIRSLYNEPIYVINIEDANHIKVIKLVRGDIEVQEDLNKS
jgi:hypothetical protein